MIPTTRQILGLQCAMMLSIGVDLAGILGDAWRAPKVGRCRVGWGMVRPTRGSGGAQWSPGQTPGRKGIVAYFEGHRTLLFVPI